MRLAALTSSRPFLWLVLGLPGLWIAGRWLLTPDAYGYGHAISDSGLWAAWLLMATLAATPLRLLFRRARWTQTLMRRRRDLGVASFAYAAAHTLVYLTDKAPAVWTDDLASAYILAGWAALALFVPLAITSNDRAVRAMKRGWKRLHKLVYPAAVLTFAHWALSAFDPLTAYLHMGVLAAIELLRIALQSRQRVT